MIDDLHTLTDDMTAFIEGHGMKRFFGYVDAEEVQCVKWSENHADGWKDFVELAKSAECSFVTMHAWTLERAELDELAERLKQAQHATEDDMEEARWLKAHLGQTGFIQLGFAYQGSMFLHESATEWYEHYECLVALVDDFSFALDQPDAGEEH